MTSRPTLVHRAATTTGALLGLGATAALLALSGRTLPLPGTASPGALSRWATEAGPATATFTAARALAMVLLGWFAVTWVLAVAARLLRLPAAVRAADGVTLPFVRRLADIAAGATIVAVSLVPAAHAGAAGTDTDPLVVMRDLGPTAAATTTTTTTTTTEATVPSSTTVPASTTTTTTEAAEAVDPTADPAAPDTATPPPSMRSNPPAGTRDEIVDAGGAWLIEPGDTLWHVAERTAADRLGRTPSGGEILGQLDRLVALNADRLAIPGDADLVFPGQEFLIP